MSLEREKDAPFNVTTTTIACPFNDNTELPIELGWVNHDYPVLHLNAPEVLAHLRKEHGHT